MPRLSHIVKATYNDKTITVIGGVERAAYTSGLIELGFSRVLRSYNNKDLKRLPGNIRKSDIALLVGGCCSHNQRKKAKDLCKKAGTKFATVVGSYGPNNIVQYLVDNYERFR